MKRLLRKIGWTSLMVITYPLFRVTVGDKYTGDGFVKDVVFTWEDS